MFPTVSGQVSEGPRVIEFHETMKDSLAFGTLNGHDSLGFWKPNCPTAPWPHIVVTSNATQLWRDINHALFDKDIPGPQHEERKTFTRLMTLIRDI